MSHIIRLYVLTIQTISYQQSRLLYVEGGSVHTSPSSGDERDHNEENHREESEDGGYPANDNEPLDNLAVVECVARLAAVNLVGQSGQGRRADDVEDEAADTVNGCPCGGHEDSHDDGDQVGEETKRAVASEELEANTENHWTKSAG